MSLYNYLGEEIVAENGDSSVLSGKKWAVCGDSITSGEKAGEQDENGKNKTYAWFIAERNNMTLYDFGISGSTITNNGAAIALTPTRYKTIPTDCDYITLWYGINDSKNTIGTIDDAEDTTFYGAFNVVLTYLLNNMPATTKIGLVVSHGMVTEKRDAILAVAKKYGLKVFDIPGDANIPYWDNYRIDDTGEAVLLENEEIRTLRHNQWFADHNHPNARGYEYISTAFEAWLKTL